MAIDSIIVAAVAFLSRHPLLYHMGEALLQALAGDLSMAYFPAGSVVLAPDSATPKYRYIVQRGLV
jgi:signal-transduction protein with cAMP-binding, CBS, and nucleotidyltransferase domain